MSLDPDFSRDAGRALSSPYFVSPPADLDGDDLIGWWAERMREKDLLADAAAAADGYDDLPAEAKGVYDRAAEAIEQAMNLRDVLARIHGG